MCGREKVMGNFDKFIIFIVAGLTSIVYGLKVWDDLSLQHKETDTPKPVGTLWRNAIYGGFGSGLVCLLVFEGLLYYTELPYTLILLIGALCGFTGADSFKDLLLRFIEAKFNSAPPARRSNEKE